MSDNHEYAGDVTAKQAWEILQEDQSAVLLDVRTQCEWKFVGVADLNKLGKQPVFVQWLFFPDMRSNAEFASQVADGGVGEDHTVITMCRSGQRSRAAAIALTSLGYKKCYNLADGFEGNRDAANHRGLLAGWKADGLTWSQA